MNGEEYVAHCEVRSNYVGVESPHGEIRLADLVSVLHDTRTGKFSMTWKVERGTGNGVVDTEDTVEGDSFEEVFLRYIARRITRKGR